MLAEPLIFKSFEDELWNNLKRKSKSNTLSWENPITFFTNNGKAVYRNDSFAMILRRKWK